MAPFTDMAVHITSFYGKNGRPIMKEVAIVSLNKTLIENWIVALPYDFYDLESDEMDMCLLKEALLGLRWNHLGLSCPVTYEKLNLILKEADQIYVKDDEVANIIRFYTEKNKATILPYTSDLTSGTKCTLDVALKITRQVRNDKSQNNGKTINKSEEKYTEMKSLRSKHIYDVLKSARSCEEKKPKVKKHRFLGAKTLFAWLILTMISPVKAMVGYDCSVKQMNVGTLSLLDIEKCNVIQPETKITQIKVSLLQHNDYQKVKVIQCKIIIDRHITYCGMHSHNPIVENGDFQYIQKIESAECQQMHTTKSMTIGQAVTIEDLQPNGTFSTNITFAGQITTEGRCSGTYYADPYGSWSDVVVSGWIMVELNDYYADVNLETNMIKLKSGTTCKLTENQCTDIKGGPTFWNAIPVRKCHEARYDILYEGLVDKSEGINNGEQVIVYTVTTNEYAFGLLKKGYHKICGYNLIKTEHPKLFIIEEMKEMQFIHKPLLPTNMDIYNYINSQFVYVERHIGKQMMSLYHNLLKYKCELKMKALRNQFTLATTAPDQFAYLLMKKPGYIAVMAGKVIHIIQCLEVEVKFRRTKECYQQLPVTKVKQNGEEKKLFLTPRTQMIVEQGTRIECDTMILHMYNILETWYNVLGTPVEGKIPIRLRPSINQVQEHKSPQNLAASGIYTNEELRKFREHIMLLAERPAVLDKVVQSLMDQENNMQGLSIAGMIDERSLKKIADSTWNYVRGTFLSFGTASVGILGFVMILRAIKLLVDTIIHEHALHTIYGWSIHLVRAIWDSVTNLLIHLGKKPREEKNATNDIELGEETRPEMKTRNREDIEYLEKKEIYIM